MDDTITIVSGGDASLGLEDGGVKDELFTASSCSAGTTPQMARLNSGDSWCAGDVNNCFIQVDLGKRHVISAIATQGNRAPTSRKDYVSKYKLQHSNDGIKWSMYEELVHLECIMEKDELDDVSSLMKSGAVDDAKRLYEAMKGWGTDEETLIDILCSRNNAELAAIRDIYKENYVTALVDALRGDLSGYFRTLLVELSKGERSEPSEVNIELAQKDANDLLKAGVEKWGTDEDAFIRVFTQRNLLQLSATFSEYEKLGKGDMASTIQSEMSGDLRKSLLMLVNIVTNPAKFFAARLHVALNGGDWTAVCRIVFNRNRVDVEEVSTAFKAAYGSELIHEIEIVEIAESKYEGIKKALLLRKLCGRKAWEVKIFEGNTDHVSVKRNTMKHPIMNRFVRVYPLEWYVWPCMSIELYGTPIIEPEHVVTSELISSAPVDVLLEFPVETIHNDDTVTVDVEGRRWEDEREKWERDRNIWEEDKKRLEEELRKYKRERETHREGGEKNWEAEWNITEEKRMTCERNRKELIDDKTRWEKEKGEMEQDWEKKEEELKRKVEKERQMRDDAEKKREMQESELKRKIEEERQMRDDAEKKREMQESELKRKIEEERKKREQAEENTEVEKDWRNKEEELKRKIEEERQMREEEEKKREMQESEFKRKIEEERKKREQAEENTEAEKDWRNKEEELKRQIEEERQMREEAEKKREMQESEFKRKIEEEQKKREQAEEKLKVILVRERMVRSGNRKPSQEDEKEEPRKHERRPSAVDRMIEREQKIRKEEWERFDNDKRLWEEQRLKFQDERKKWDVKRMEWEGEYRQKEHDKRQEENNQRKASEGRRLSEEEKDKRKASEGRRLSEEENNQRKASEGRRLSEEEKDKRKASEGRRLSEEEKDKRKASEGRRLSEEEKDKRKVEPPAVVNGLTSTTYTTHVTTTVVKVKPTEPNPEEFKPEVHFRPIQVAAPVLEIESVPNIDDGFGSDENGVEDEYHGPRDHHVHHDDQSAPLANSNDVCVEDEDDVDYHDFDTEGHFDNHKHFMRSCDHLLAPVDHAAANAAASSFFSKYEESESNLRPFPSWYGGIDMGSASHLYQSCNPFSELDIERLLFIENEGMDGWRRLKRSRELEIWRKEGKGPLTIKATMILTKIPFKNAVDSITDWSIRNQWDPTFDSVHIVDEADDFRVLKCCLKKNPRCLALATMDVENTQGPYHVMLWRNTNHPSVPDDPHMTLMTLDTAVCGMVIRPYHDGSKFSKISIITQLQCSAPGSLKNTYLTGNPSKWLNQLKKYHVKCLEQQKKTQKALESQNES